MADYRDEKAVVIFKDTSSVFTLVDWPEKANWAVLHFARNDQTGENSRTEELYSLIDLKNKRVVDRELEKCTGASAMFQFIEQDEDGNDFISANGEYKVELK